MYSFLRYFSVSDKVDLRVVRNMFSGGVFNFPGISTFCRVWSNLDLCSFYLFFFREELVVERMSSFIYS